MRTRNRILIASLAATLLMVLPLPALAGDEMVDKAADRPSDGPQVVDTRPHDVVDPSDRCDPRRVDRRHLCTDRETDVRVVDRCHDLVDRPIRCLERDHTDHINIRHLIWRLINAHEWEKLFRLLHWLGWI